MQLVPVPADVEHVLIWTRLPIIDFSQVSPQIHARLYQDGLWGFTGCSSPPPSPSSLPSCLPSLADWDVTLDKLIRSPKGTPEEDEMVREAGREVDQFVRNRWIPDDFETAYFVNPPVRLQPATFGAHSGDSLILLKSAIHAEASKHPGFISHSRLRTKKIGGGHRTRGILSRPWTLPCSSCLFWQYFGSSPESQVGCRKTKSA
jgi:hypothetical protein